jgi:para-nitrobenzyl esterase
MSRTRLRVVVLLAATVACQRHRAPYRIASADQATIRHLPAGDVIGGEGRYGSLAWLGIPYAKPPVGELRWRAPEPAGRWSGTREALAFGAPCVQYGSRFGGAPGARPGEPAGDEDCLTLNVWTPRAAPAATKLPVFVWIHGGGNSIGHASFYDGGNLAATESLVVVSVQYRLGPFGWFRHPALRAGAATDTERSGNFGTLDLVHALEWVRDNIAGFGGDPGNVTIAGESAGGLNVFTLLLARPARGLFHRAIVESGGLWSDTPAAAENAADDPEPGHAQSSSEIALRLLQRDGRARDRADAKTRLAAMPGADVAAWLRAKPAREILTAYKPWPTGMIDMPRVFSDGAALPAGDFRAALERPEAWNHVPVLVGTNRDENKLFMFADPRRVRLILWFLPRVIDEPRYEASSEYLARSWKVAGADGPAVAMTASEPRVFVYRFDWREEPTLLGADLSTILGAAHGFEIPFVFGHFDLGREGSRIFTRANEPGRQALSHAMMSYWAEFARTGAPGRGRGGDLPAWEPWADGRSMVFDTPAGGGVRMTAGIETREHVIADVDADARLPTQRDRCRVFREVADFGRMLTRADYPHAGREGCAEFPYDAYPSGS